MYWRFSGKPVFYETGVKTHAHFARQRHNAVLRGRRSGPNLAPNLFPEAEHASLRQTFIERWAENDPNAYIEATRSMLGWDVTGQLGSLHCPTLIVASDQDYTPVATKKAYTELIPNAQISVIANAHHAVPIERPQEFNAVLAQFLARFD